MTALERLTDADAEVILFTGMGLGSDAGDFASQRKLLAQIKANPLWAQLGAVQANRAFEVRDHRLARDWWPTTPVSTTCSGSSWVADEPDNRGRRSASAPSPYSEGGHMTPVRRRLDSLRGVVFRRRARVVAVALILVATACGSAERTAPSVVPATAGAFPVTIEHRYGAATIPKTPQRVVSVGYHEQDTILALGVKPVGVREWLGKKPYAVHPWAEDELGDARPTVLEGELNYEQIAALRPDLIVATSALLEEQQYTTLAKIAPTIVEPSNYVGFGMPWQEITRTIGRALGRAERADALVSEVEGRFARARDQHPQFKGRSGLVAYDFGAGGLGAYGPQDPRSRVLNSLGLEVPKKIEALAGDQFYAQISGEQVQLLEADVLVWILFLEGGARSRIENDPIYPGLRVAKQGRDVFLDQTDPLQAALSFSTVLSLPFVIDKLVPKLAAAIDGDPATKVPRS